MITRGLDRRPVVNKSLFLHHHNNEEDSGDFSTAEYKKTRDMEKVSR
jgi:hypothetical protein